MTILYKVLDIYLSYLLPKFQPDPTMHARAAADSARAPITHRRRLNLRVIILYNVLAIYLSCLLRKFQPNQTINEHMAAIFVEGLIVQRLLVFAYLFETWFDLSSQTR